MHPDADEDQIPLFDLEGSKSPALSSRKSSPRPTQKVDGKKRSKPLSASRAKKKTSPVKNRSGLVPEGDVRLTANIREDLHLRLKIAAAKKRTTIGEIIEDLVEKHIS